MERRVGASRVAVRFERPARPTDARHGDARDDDDGDGDGDGDGDARDGRSRTRRLATWTRRTRTRTRDRDGATRGGG